MVIYLVAAVLFGFGAGVAVTLLTTKRTRNQAQNEAQDLIKDAEVAAHEIKTKLLADVEEERRRFRQEIQRQEDRVRQREEKLEHKKDELAVQLISRIDEFLSQK